MEMGSRKAFMGNLHLQDEPVSCGYASRSLKEVLTGLELCHGIYPSLPASTVTTLIDESNRIADGAQP
jgi:hypothetical protein